MEKYGSQFVIFYANEAKKVLMCRASISEMICMVLNYNPAKLNISTTICSALGLTRPTITSVLI